MCIENIELRHLRVEDETRFRSAVDEFKATEPDWAFAFAFDESGPFSDYVEKLALWTKGKNLPEAFVANTFLVGAVGDTIVGRVSIRHTLNDFLARIGGHIGYGVVPSHRNRGYATEMLRQALPVASAIGIDRVLITCDDNNPASRRVIEKNGGIYDGVIASPESDVPKRRYWINIGDQI